MPVHSRSFELGPRGEKEKGEQLFKDKCASCHTVHEEEGHSRGPNLHRVFGRISGTGKDYNYSPPVRVKRLIWDEETLYEFLRAPTKYIPLSGIECPAVPDAKQRADLVCYLKEAAGKTEYEHRPM